MMVAQVRVEGGNSRVEKRSGALTSITLFNMKLGSFRFNRYRSTGSIRSHCS
jgi:hypothetical protein